VRTKVAQRGASTFKYVNTSPRGNLSRIADECSRRGAEAGGGPSPLSKFSQELKVEL
jgi:hypothetical protein